MTLGRGSIVSKRNERPGRGLVGYEMWDDGKVFVAYLISHISHRPRI